MKHVYVFNQRVMNGTVTMDTIPCATATRELAEKARNKIMEIWAKDPQPYRMIADDIQEIPLFEDKSEVKILNEGKVKEGNNE